MSYTIYKNMVRGVQYNFDDVEFKYPYSRVKYADVFSATETVISTMKKEWTLTDTPIHTNDTGKHIYIYQVRDCSAAYDLDPAPATVVYCIKSSLS